MVNTRNRKNVHEGSNFDDFLAEEGILEECESVARKRIIAWQLTQTMEKQGVSKSEMAKRMKTSRASLNRLLDPDNDSVTLHTMVKACEVLGKKLRLEMVDA